MRAIDQPTIQRRVAEILNRWPAVGLAFGVVRGSSVESFSAHGLADIDTGSPVTKTPSSGSPPSPRRSPRSALARRHGARGA